MLQVGKRKKIQDADRLIGHIAVIHKSRTLFGILDLLCCCRKIQLGIEGISTKSVLRSKLYSEFFFHLLFTSHFHNRAIRFFRGIKPP